MRVRRVTDTPLPRRVPLARAADQAWLGLASWWAARGMPSQDAIVVYSPPQPLALTAAALRRAWGCPIVVNVQDVYPQTGVELGLLRGRAMLAASGWMERYLYRTADAITVYAEGTRDYLIARGNTPARVHVIPNWVDLEAIYPGPRENAWRQAHGLEGAFVVSFAGTMGFAQGLAEVVLAAERLAHLPDLRLVLAGAGVLRGPLERMAREKRLRNLLFLPPQEGADYLGLLHASDACLVPLDARLTVPVVPGKLQVLMAAGRPVVCTANPATGLEQLIEGAGCGLFTPAGDPDALARAIRRLHDDATLSEGMGRAGRAYADRHYRRQDSTGAYAALLTGLVERRRVEPARP